MANGKSGVSSSEKRIKKGKPITLLSILCFVMVFLIVMTFVRFPMGLKNYNSVLGAIDLDYDMVGGSAYTLDYLEDENLEEIDDIDQVLDTLRYRMNALGYKTFSVKAVKSTDASVKDYDIRIEAKTTDTIDSDISVVAAYGEVSVFGGTDESSATEILTEKKAIKTAKYSGQGVGYDNSGNEVTAYKATIEFTDYGYTELKKLIKDNGTYYVAIKLGETTVFSDTLSTEGFKQSFVISSTSEAAVRQAALQIASGGLAYKYEIKSEGSVTIKTPYGENIGLKSTIMVIVLLVLIIAAFAVFYKGIGGAMGLSLLAFIILEVIMLIAVPGIVLSIAGLFGIILATVITALCLWLTADKIKTDYANSEKTVKAAVKKGFKDCIFPIVNINVVSAVVAILLFAFTTGGVNCFAITFGIGIVLGTIASLLFSRMFTSLIMPIAEFNEKFLGLKRSDKKVVIEGEN